MKPDAYGWMPIEALGEPFDCDEILGFWVIPGGSGCIAVLQWVPEWIDMTPGGDVGPCAWMANGEPGTKPQHPTHFMPLPMPPETYMMMVDEPERELVDWQREFPKPRKRRDS